MKGVGGILRAVTVAVGLAACAREAPPPAPPPPPRPAPPPPALPAPPPPSRELAAPPIALTLVDGPTAEVFHLVDELSAWHPPSRSEYAQWATTELALDDAERAMLAAHAKLRTKRRWGGLDQAFEVQVPLAEAVQAAVMKKLVSAADAEAESALLAHFAQRLSPFLTAHAPSVEAFEARLRTELPRVLPLLAQLGRFCEVTDTVAVRAVVVPRPAPVATPARRYEGRATRTSIVVEIGEGEGEGEDALPAFFHQLAHALLLRRRGTIAMGAVKCDEPIDDETIEEAIAYAFAPGLVHAGRDGEGDALRAQVEADRAARLSDPHVRAARLGLALRTELSSALEGGHETMASFLPKVCEAWANVVKP